MAEAYQDDLSTDGEREIQTHVQRAHLSAEGEREIQTHVQRAHLSTEGEGGNTRIRCII
jgi:hypothetical protein